MGWQINYLVLSQAVLPKLTHVFLHFDWVAAEKIGEVFENFVDHNFFLNLVVQVKNVKYCIHALF